MQETQWSTLDCLSSQIFKDSDFLKKCLLYRTPASKVDESTLL
jgi:hypothetical protein